MAKVWLPFPALWLMRSPKRPSTRLNTRNLLRYRSQKAARYSACFRQRRKAARNTTDGQPRAVPTWRTENECRIHEIVGNHGESGRTRSREMDRLPGLWVSPVLPMEERRNGSKHCLARVRKGRKHSHQAHSRVEPVHVLPGRRL